MTPATHFDKTTLRKNTPSETEIQFLMLSVWLQLIATIQAI